MLLRSQLGIGEDQDLLRFWVRVKVIVNVRVKVRFRVQKDLSFNP